MTPVLAAAGAAVGARAVGALVVLLSGLGSMWERARQRRRERKEAEHAPNPRRLTGTDLAGRRPSQRELSAAELSDADLRRVRLTDRSLSDRDLSHSLLTNANLTGVHAAAAVFDDADLAWASLRRADLTGASFARANLLETDFSHCWLAGADFRGAVALSSALWRDSRCDRTTRWPAGFSPTVMGIRIVRPGNGAEQDDDHENEQERKLPALPTEEDSESSAETGG